MRKGFVAQINEYTDNKWKSPKEGFDIADA